MHFVAMLAFYLPVPIAYDISLLVESALAAVVASFLALFIASHRTLTAGPLCLVGVCMGDGLIRREAAVAEGAMRSDRGPRAG